MEDESRRNARNEDENEKQAGNLGTVCIAWRRIGTQQDAEMSDVSKGLYRVVLSTLRRRAMSSDDTMVGSSGIPESRMDEEPPFFLLRDPGGGDRPVGPPRSLLSCDIAETPPLRLRSRACPNLEVPDPIESIPFLR